MDMKVNRAYSVYDVYNTQKSSTRGRVSRAQEKSDSCEFSQAAVFLQTAHNAVNKADSKSESELQAIKERYKSGDLPSSYDIASKIVESSFDKLV